MARVAFFRLCVGAQIFVQALARTLVLTGWTELFGSLGPGRVRSGQVRSAAVCQTQGHAAKQIPLDQLHACKRSLQGLLEGAQSR